MAAIIVEQKYYSLIKVSKDTHKTLTICSRLMQRGGEVVITKIPKGNAIWRYEPDAVVELNASPGSGIPHTPICKILDSSSQYQPCLIRVPDLDDRLQAIQVGGKYYGLFKTVETRQQALEIASRLGRRGDDSIITRDSQGESVWVWEPDARPL
jgi:hypothetical protein